MKVRESGMPEEEIWSQFFDVDLIFSELEINSSIQDMAEVGCGYGTFTIPAAKHINGNLYSFDIENEMIVFVKQKLKSETSTNVILYERDVLTHSSGLPENSMDYVMLFNIMHHHSPEEFLNEAFRILKPMGKIGIIHWRSDIATPRGPDLSIRPSPEKMMEWIDLTKFKIEKPGFWLPPYHYGMILSKH
ncbi:MAG: class I SAM-dependent methyltransferase [Bacteroidota bacterium]